VSWQRRIGWAAKLLGAKTSVVRVKEAVYLAVLQRFIVEEGVLLRSVAKRVLLVTAFCCVP
jgi:hypothetical protein